MSGARQWHGPAARDARAVFEMFTQGHAALDKSRGGLGVGLAIVRRARWSCTGGHVEATSAGEHEGSEFAWHLPARAVADGSDGPRASRACRPCEGRRRRAGAGSSSWTTIVDLADSLAMMLQFWARGAHRPRRLRGSRQACICARSHLPRHRDARHQRLRNMSTGSGTVATDRRRCV